MVVLIWTSTFSEAGIADARSENCWIDFTVARRSNDAIRHALHLRSESDAVTHHAPSRILHQVDRVVERGDEIEDLGAVLKQWSGETTSGADGRSSPVLGSS